VYPTVLVVYPLASSRATCLFSASQRSKAIVIPTTMQPKRTLAGPCKSVRAITPANPTAEHIAKTTKNITIRRIDLALGPETVDINFHSSAPKHSP
jgi:hypothetical protein